MATVSSKPNVLTAEPAPRAGDYERTRANPSSSEASYWKANLRLLLPLLVVWFAVSFGAGIIFVEPLNTLHLPFTEAPLGFWFAQQGSIYCFVALIFVYVKLMKILERDLGVQEDDG